MLRRLTVHVDNADFFRVKDRKSGQLKSCIQNTLSFKVKNESEGNDLLEGLKRAGTPPTKHYYSNLR